VKITELKELTEQRDLLREQRPNKANRAKLKEIEAQMQPLVQFLDEAKRQRAAIKKEVGMNLFAHVDNLTPRQPEESP
jgi:flagellar biosynthesis/type III secretory pathway chaperone